MCSKSEYLTTDGLSSIEFKNKIKQYLDKKYVVFEGIDGSGKTTIQKWLGEQFPDFVFVREPGSTPFGEEIRKSLLEADFNLEPFTEFLLFMASRNELLNKKLKPYLGEKTVISDRSYISTYAYQVVHNDISFDIFQDIVQEIYREEKINFIVYFKISPEESLKRLNAVREEDNIESKGLEYFYKTEEAYNDYFKFLTREMKALLVEEGNFELYQDLHDCQTVLILNAETPLDMVKTSFIKAVSYLYNFS